MLHNRRMNGFSQRVPQELTTALDDIRKRIGIFLMGAKGRTANKKLGGDESEMFPMNNFLISWWNR